MLTTHYLDEADSMAERVVVIDHGRVIADDTAGPAQGRRWPATGSRSTFADDAGGAARPRGPSGSAAPRRRASDGATVASGSPDGPALRARRCCATSTRPASRSPRAEVARPTLDDVFLALTGRSLREGAEPRPPSDRRRCTTEHRHEEQAA